MDLKEMLEDIITPIKLDEGRTFKKFLTEADDFGGDDAGGGDDPFAGGGDDAGDDAGGGDPFGAPAGGDDAGSGDAAGGDSAGGETDTDGDNKEDKPELDLEGHEDDPEFLMGTENNDDVTLSDTPAGKMLYDTEKVMNTLVTVIQTLKDTELTEVDKVKTAVELVFNGKKLKDEDLEFSNLKNAISLIKKIGAKLDTRTRAYLYRKIKEPLIKKRDQIKQDIAIQKGELQNAREMLTAIDVK